MYNSFFGFNSKPFQITPDPRFLYLSPNHKQALTHIEYGLIDHVGLIALTGEVGTGKTTIIRFIVEHLCGDKQLAVIYHTNVPPGEFFRLILRSFDLQPENNHKDSQLDTFIQFLKTKQAQKRQVLIIIDEAQGLSEETLEEVRLLTNIQMNFADVMQIMLMGQPELLDRLKSERWESLSQRIGVGYHLGGLDLKQTCLYIAYRLKKVGAKSNPFSIDALKLIYKSSQGIPRLINLICDAALVYAYGDDRQAVDKAIVETVVKERAGLGLKQKLGRLQVQGSKKSAGNGFGHMEKRLKAVENDLLRINNQIECIGEDISILGTKSKSDLIIKVKMILAKERRLRTQMASEIGQLKTLLKKNPQVGGKRS